MHCLHQPVTDHPLRLRAEHIERERARQGRILSAFQRQHADLGAIPVRDDDLVRSQQRSQGCRRSIHVGLLDARIGLLATLQQRVAAERGDDPHSCPPSGASHQRRPPVT